jgi:hypothetical protein
MEFELAFDQVTAFCVALRNNDKAKVVDIIQDVACQNNIGEHTSYYVLSQTYKQFEQAIASSPSFLITSEQKRYLKEKFAAVSVINIDDPIFSVLAKQNNMSIQSVAFMVIAIVTERKAIEPA